MGQETHKAGAADLNRAPHELPAGRELDAAVARKMGRIVGMAEKAWSFEDWFGSDVPTETNTLAILNPDFKPGALEPPAIILPRYSEPDDDADKAALLDCILWLAQRGTYIDMGIYNTFGLGNGDVAAFALAICRAVVRL